MTTIDFQRVAPPAAWVKRHSARDFEEESGHVIFIDHWQAPTRLSSLVLRALIRSQSDFRSTGSLASELGVSDAEVRAALTGLGSKVRRPLGKEGAYPDLYRLTERGPTLHERWWKWRAVLAKTPISNG